MTVMDTQVLASWIQPPPAAAYSPAAGMPQARPSPQCIVPENKGQESCVLTAPAPSPWPRVFPGL